MVLLYVLLELEWWEIVKQLLKRILFKLHPVEDERFSEKIKRMTEKSLPKEKGF